MASRLSRAIYLLLRANGMRFFLRLILSIFIVVLLFGLYLTGQYDREVRSLLPPEIHVKIWPLVRHTERGWMHGCHLRVWELRPDSAEKLRNEGRAWLENLDFDRHPSINTSRNYRLDPWLDITNSAVSNPIGFLNLECFGFDRHSLVQIFENDKTSYFQLIGGESHVGFIFYPDSGRVLVLVSSS